MLRDVFEEVKRRVGRLFVRSLNELGSGELRPVEHHLIHGTRKIPPLLEYSDICLLCSHANFREHQRSQRRASVMIRPAPMQSSLEGMSCTPVLRSPERRPTFEWLLGLQDQTIIQSLECAWIYRKSVELGYIWFCGLCGWYSASSSKCRVYEDDSYTPDRQPYVTASSWSGKLTIPPQIIWCSI